ncbi:MAG: RNA repair domain-containing protein [Acidilobaceae archaeon]
MGLCGLGRRSVIKQVILKFRILGYNDYLVGYRDRVHGLGERISYFKISDIASVEGETIELNDGSLIPIHRIVEVRDCRGELVWRRW